MPKFKIIICIIFALVVGFVGGYFLTPVQTNNNDSKINSTVISNTCSYQDDQGYPGVYFNESYSNPSFDVQKIDLPKGFYLRSESSDFKTCSKNHPIENSFNSALFGNNESSEIIQIQSYNRNNETLQQWIKNNTSLDFSLQEQNFGSHVVMYGERNPFGPDEQFKATAFLLTKNWVHILTLQDITYENSRIEDFKKVISSFLSVN